MEEKNLLCRVLLPIIGLVLLHSNSSAQLCYANNITTNAVNFSIASADFNKDGILDIAMADMNYSVWIMFGDGKGNFSNISKFKTDSMPMSVIAADFNGDGEMDLATCSMMNMTVSILLGNGSGSFAQTVKFPVGNTPQMIISADFNKDNHLDIATVNSVSNNVSVLLGNGNGTFQDSVSYKAGTTPLGISTADFNKDGKPDLVVSNSGANNVSVLLGNGNGTFTGPTNIAVGVNLISYPIGINCADLNADTFVDIVTVSGGQDSLFVLFGKGNGTFNPSVGFGIVGGTGSGPTSASVICADFEGDGDLDIASIDISSDDVFILLNDGTGKFTPEAAYAVGNSPYFAVSEDFNKDGKLDIAVANSTSNNVSILLNCRSGTIGITEITSSSITVFPNPNNGKFQIAGNTINYEIEIENLQGQKIYSSSSGQLVDSTIDVSNQPNGIYFLKLTSETGSTTVSKIIVQK